MSVKIRLDSLAATERCAQQLAPLLRHGDMVLLQGEVGAGKTSFTRFLIHALQVEPEEVTSPTFTLVQPYEVQLSDGARAMLSHYDLYRLEDPSELQEVAIDDALEQGVAVIEWPEIVGAQWQGEALQLHFTLDTLGEIRELSVKAPAEWQARIAQWEEALHEQRERA